MPSHRAVRRLGCLLSLVLACTDKGDDLTEGASSDAETGTTQATAEQPTDAQTTPGETTGEPVAGCECADGEPCDAQLCETADLNENGGGAGADAAFEAALTCALEALRDRKAGRIAWRFRIGDGEIDEQGALVMFGDGTARYTRGGVQDLCEWTVDDVTVVTLAEPDAIADCLTNPSVYERFDCLREAPASEVATCVDGETNCGGV